MKKNVKETEKKVIKKKPVSRTKEKVKEIKKEEKIYSDIEEKPKTKKKRKIKFRFWYWLMILIVFFALLCFLGGVGFCYYIVKSAPEFNVEKMFEKEASRIFDANGNIFATLGTEQREKITYNELPEVLIDAIIATEDSRFFQHNGFDAPRFIKASLSQVLGRGGGGASTLTMQLSKLSFTSTTDEGIAGIIRKFTDIYMAVFKMEKHFTKEEIIEYYVNTPCLGGNIYGVEQASKYYFGKSAKDLNLVEAAQIAGMFQSPNGYNPYYNPNDANARKNTVLYLMKRHGYITEDEYKAGTSVEIKDMLTEGTRSSNKYQGFIDTVVQEVIDRTGNDPYAVPMDVYTTMVTSKQDVINNFYDTYKFKDAKVEAGIGVIDNKTGAIIAVGAGRYKKDAMTMNLATFHGQTLRAPGSTAKPIIDYGPAIEYKGLSTYGPFIDEKTTYAGSYMRNFSGGYSGMMSMADCLRKSINTCALQAFRMTSNEQKLKFANSLGIKFTDYKGDEIKYLPESFSIGTFNGVSPVQLAAAYAAFGNGGYYTEPHSFTKVEYRETGEVYELELEKTKVMKPQTAYIITNVLIGATNSRVKVSGTQIATKTGTTSYDTDYLKKFGLTSNVIPDSWTSSYSPDYAIAIWYGYIDGLTSETVKNKWYLKNNEAGTERFKIQAAVVNKIYEKNSKFKSPGGLSAVEVELETIPPMRPSENTPSNMRKTYTFVSGTEPSEVSTRYAKISDIGSATYTVENNKINLNWTAAPTPDAIDTNFLSTYFKENYGEWADQYYNKRLDYNNKNVGVLGYSVYLTQGDTSKYIGFTTNTNYSIDLTTLSGIYDGVIIKSEYSILKSTASDGYKLVFTTTPTITPGIPEETKPETPITPQEPTDNENIDESKVVIKMNGLYQSLTVGASYKELGTYAIDSITYNGKNIKSDVNNLSVTTVAIKKSDNTSITPNDITAAKGKYIAEYSVSFTYKNKHITRSFTQTVVVN